MSNPQAPSPGSNPPPNLSDNDPINNPIIKGNYPDLHKPSSSFENRDAYLNHELQIMQPKRWRPNLPFRDYRFEYEDTIPAMAATIGKVVMVGAIAATFAGPLGLGDAFVLENVRYELLIVSFFIVLFSGFLLPTANLAGTHGPLIPLIPIVVAAGGHPMAFGLLIGAFGLLLANSPPTVPSATHIKNPESSISPALYTVRLMVPLTINATFKWVLKFAIKTHLSIALKKTFRVAYLAVKKRTMIP